MKNGPRTDKPVDLLIAGGGINGAGIARDAAGRGLSVLLCEQNDLASGTSSASSKLIHGGLRYLEYLHIRLVREALAEREVLLEIAPHIVRPMRFVLPHVERMRPVWMLRLGLFMYDLLGRRRRLPPSRRINLRRHEAGLLLRPDYTTAFSYSDCWADDARLVVLNAMDAAHRGAEILTRTRLTNPRREGGLWQATLNPADGAEPYAVTARALVYAAGPWMQRILEENSALSEHRLLLVKGSHLVFPQFFEGEHAFILQNDDERIVFAIPYLDRYTLVGTTDVAYEGDPSSVQIDGSEKEYLCAVVNRYFDLSVSPSDAVWAFAGLRPLIDDASDNPSSVSREYVLDLNAPSGEAPAVSVIGGKLTAYRQVAEKTMQLLRPFFSGMGARWTASASLPGGDMPNADFEAFLADLPREFPWLAASHRDRLARAYGTRLHDLLGDAQSVEHLGECFGADLYEREVRYLMHREWAHSADDILWRRGKFGLALTDDEAARLQSWMETHRAEA